MANEYYFYFFRQSNKFKQYKKIRRFIKPPRKSGWNSFLFLILYLYNKKEKFYFYKNFIYVLKPSICHYLLFSIIAPKKQNKEKK